LAQLSAMSELRADVRNQLAEMELDMSQADSALLALKQKTISLKDWLIGFERAADALSPVVELSTGTADDGAVTSMADSPDFDYA
jgi:hypothetical protein